MRLCGCLPGLFSMVLQWPAWRERRCDVIVTSCVAPWCSGKRYGWGLSVTSAFWADLIRMAVELGDHYSHFFMFTCFPLLFFNFVFVFISYIDWFSFFPFFSFYSSLFSFLFNDRYFSCVFYLSLSSFVSSLLIYLSFPFPSFRCHAMSRSR